VRELSDTDPAAFAVEHADVATGATIAYVRAGTGGHPLVLLHGWPETKRIWWRNIGPLADAGFEVIVPDLRGFGDSSLAPDGFYDPAVMAADVDGLVRGVLGHTTYDVAGGDVGGVVAQQLSLAMPGVVGRMCLFNTIPPFLADAYEQAGIPHEPKFEHRPTADYFVRQGRDADGLAAELDTPERRRRYIGEFYGHRLWSPPGSFTPPEVDFMTEPFADGEILRASFGTYEVALGTRPMSELPRLFEVNPTPGVVLWGPDDQVIHETFPAKCAVAFPNCAGPFHVPGAGHFLQWDAADLLNRTLTGFLLPR